MLPKLAVISVRAGITQEIADKLFLDTMEHHSEEDDGIWVVRSGNYVIGQGKNKKYVTVFPCPFEGHKDDWQVVLPITCANDLAKQLI
jgi:hypothetical protein